MVIVIIQRTSNSFLDAFTIWCCFYEGFILLFFTFTRITMFNFTIQRSSQSIVAINCQIQTGFVLVSFKNGSTYAYNNVSKRAIMMLWLDYAFTNENISLGFWVNNNCIKPNRVKYANLTGVADYYGSPENYFASASV